MHLTNYERETIINFNEDEKTACVYTHNKALRHKLKELAASRPEGCHLERTSHDEQAMSYIIPKRWVKVIPPRKSVLLTDEQREEKRENMRKVNLLRFTHDQHNEND